MIASEPGDGEEEELEDVDTAIVANANLIAQVPTPKPVLFLKLPARKPKEFLCGFAGCTTTSASAFLRLKHHKESHQGRYPAICGSPAQTDGPPANWRMLCADQTCATCLAQSFAAHPRAASWSASNPWKPRQVFRTSQEPFSFACEICSHSFVASPGNVCQGKWCPFCSHRKLCEAQECAKCFAASFASHPKARYWDSAKNTETPRAVFQNSNKSFWFTCANCSHGFTACLNSINGGGTWCPFCCVPSQQLCEEQQCKQCFERSFASHPAASYWSEDKNRETPRAVLRSSSKSYWFTCDKCKHMFKCALGNISNGGQWCPFCSHRKLCDAEECVKCFAASFASHPKASCWSNEKNAATPRMIFRSSGKKYWFCCDVCAHAFKTTPHHVNTGGTWCPFCSQPPQQLCDRQECKQCFAKSFASHPKASRWCHEKNIVSPRSVFLKSHSRYWFRCDVESHVFKTSVASISHMGSWCPKCRNKTELFMYEWLCQQFGHSQVSRQVTFEYLRSPGTDWTLPLDFLVKTQTMQCIVELDGPQHFRQVWSWNTPLETLYRDVYKMAAVLQRGYVVIRVCQEMVRRDKMQWRAKLKELIETKTEGLHCLAEREPLYDEHCRLVNQLQLRVLQPSPAPAPPSVPMLADGGGADVDGTAAAAAENGKADFSALATVLPSTAAASFLPPSAAAMDVSSDDR